MAVSWHEELDSTNDECRRQAERGAPDGTVVAAIRQTAGRGQHGRNWSSLAGNLHVSFLLRPAPSPARAPEIGFAAALAVAETVEHFLPPAVPARLKWPNDVLVADGKIAGILLERSAGADGGSWLVLGIGINLAAAPPDVAYPARALAEFVPAPRPAEALAVLEPSLRGWLARREREGFLPLADAWQARGPSRGERLSVRMGDRLLAGAFAGLGPAGELLLATPEGTERVIAGEVLAAAPAEREPQQPDPPFRPPLPKEIGGPPGPEPTRYGDWQFKGRVTDF